MIKNQLKQSSIIQESTTLPELTWQLIHWILTNPLDIKPKTKSEVSDYFTDQLREETKLLSIPYPKDNHPIKITHPVEINSTSKFYLFNAKACLFFNRTLQRYFLHTKKFLVHFLHTMGPHRKTFIQ